MSDRPASLALHPLELDQVPILLCMIQEMALLISLPHPVETTESDIIRNYLNNTEGNALLIELDSQIVGYVTWYRAIVSSSPVPMMHLDDIYIRREHRNQGIGKDVMSYLQNLAHSNGYRYLFWQVLKTNTSALAFYNRLKSHTTDAYIDCYIQATPSSSLS
ncbi:GNAT family N-acetyltransferase [Marinobacter shengliensis]